MKNPTQPISLQISVLIGLGFMANVAWAETPVSIPGAGLLGQTLPSSTLVIPSSPKETHLTLPEEQSKNTDTGNQKASIIIRKVIINGLQSEREISLPRLQKTVAGFLNKPQTFSGLQAMTDALTQDARAQGLLLAQAVLPPQRISNGILTVNILPGTFDSSQINNASRLSTKRVQNIVSRVFPAGSVVQRKKIERVALLLAEIPGVRPSLSLRPGVNTGSSAMDITIMPGKRMGGYLGLDNAGISSTGRSRAVAGFYVNELLGQGDQLKVDLLSAYENNGLLTGSVDYSQLAGSFGTRVGGNYSRLGYHYSLQGLKFNGYSNNFKLYLTQPWVRTFATQVDFSADVGMQMLNDQYPSQLSVFTNGDTGRKAVTQGSVGVQGRSVWSSGGMTRFSVQGTVGRLELKNTAARFWSSSDLLNSSGEFSRLNYQLTHEQPVAGPLSLFGSVTGQQASKNLDSSQKFLMGGPAMVRAYDTGIGGVDDGAVASIELRSQWALPALWRAGEGHHLTIASFYDQGWGSQYHHNNGLTNQNSINMAGAGLYGQLTRNSDYALTLTWAHRTAASNQTQEKNSRNQFWLTAVKAF
ncbi:ShlB/FhaC/HecB family hemolysin secretion/activation protein [Yersinia ruckeri]|uniref:ShlB/FhaC/HecB family hemolysin secretion/activation protein n=1 Tax=Yersinia ruckeri TaxID=29486 RepID=UPI001F28CF7A|nr:ShlB/FhaC/HecB family hemolysin secretion/activation protein [Yersinia ruckeri]UIN02542.1 ShlB/FhaC/HecB family hemolysin secretion/activation protein [Yersinia ruckeri]